MSLPLCLASSKMSIMASGATQRSDTKVLLSLKRNTPGRLPVERRHVCPSQRVHSTANPNLTKLDRVAQALKVERNWLIHGIGEVQGEAPIVEHPDDSFVA